MNGKAMVVRGVGCMLLIAACGFAGGQVVVTTEASYEGQESFKVETPAATYYYHKEGAGFASIKDNDGVDWISYHPSGGSAGSYRGIPNLVWKSPDDDKRAFHPGHTGNWGSATTLESDEEDKATVKSVANVSGWTCTWDFYPDRAVFTLSKGAGHYWFLYEGTPNGGFDGGNNYLLRSDQSSRIPLSQEKGGDIQPMSGESHEWIFFGDKRVGRGLLLVQHHDDNNGDNYYGMENNMTVFGFGRPSGTSEVLTQVPATYTVALVEDSAFARVAEIAKEFVEGKPLATGRSRHGSTPGSGREPEILRNSQGDWVLRAPGVAGAVTCEVFTLDGRLVESRAVSADASIVLESSKHAGAVRFIRLSQRGKLIAMKVLAF